MASANRTYAITDARVTSCAADAVMKVLTDPSTWPEWQSEIVVVDGPAPLVRGDEVEGRARLLGFEVDGRSRTVDADTRVFVEDVIVGVRMHVEYEVTETDGGTRVTRRLTASLPGGISGRLLSLLLKRRLKAMQQGVLDALIAQAEGV